LQWPCPDKDHAGTQYLHDERFSCGQGNFVPLEYKPPAESADEQYSLIMTTGRSLYHFHTGTMTRKVAGLNAIHPEELVEINPADAKGIADGDRISVSSRRGKIEAKAKVTDTVPPGVVFMTFHFAESSANVLTNPAYDPISKIPELKVAAVKVEKA